MRSVPTRASVSARDPDAEFRTSDYDAYREGAVQLASSTFRFDMAVKMLMKPLGLHPMVARAMLPAVTSASRLFARSGAAASRGRVASFRAAA